MWFVIKRDWLLKQYTLWKAKENKNLDFRVRFRCPKSRLLKQTHVNFFLLFASWDTSMDDLGPSKKIPVDKIMRVESQRSLQSNKCIAIIKKFNSHLFNVIIWLSFHAYHWLLHLVWKGNNVGILHLHTRITLL